MCDFTDTFCVYPCIARDGIIVHVLQGVECACALPLVLNHAVARYGIDAEIGEYFALVTAPCHVNTLTLLGKPDQDYRAQRVDYEVSRKKAQKWQARHAHYEMLYRRGFDENSELSHSQAVQFAESLFSWVRAFNAANMRRVLHRPSGE